MAYYRWMRVLEAARPWMSWGPDPLPKARTARYLTVAVLGSLLVHLLVGTALLLTGWLGNPVIAQRGELFVETSTDRPSEPAPEGDPGRPVTPSVAARARPRAVPAQPVRPEPPAARVAPPVPRAAAPSPGTARSAEPRQPLAPPPAPPPPPPAEEPAYEGRNARAPVPPRIAKAEPAREAAPSTAPPGRESREAMVTPPAPTFAPGATQGSSGGGGFVNSQGGVVGQPVPLDTPDPDYREYMQRVRQRIYANWRYPQGAHRQDLYARLVIEFHIGRDGQLLKADIIESSGEMVLDASAMSAVKLAERYPPLPEAMRRDVLPIIAIFSYKVHAAQSSTFQLQ
jgi:TonB family protein